jgi:pimeloyl-ACP methyl ester carboxylesterase
MWRIAQRVAFVAVAAVCALATIALAPSEPPDWRVTDHARLADIAPVEMTAFIASHPGLAPEAFNADPAVVAEWWTAVPRAEQKRLTARMPEVIGNLAGVDFASRNTANRAELVRALAAASTALTKNPVDLSAVEYLAALRAIQGALGGGHGKRYLVELTSDRPPLASIAIGNLDTAMLVTFVVPGMGTLSTNMQLWTRAAQNVYDAQGAAGASKRRAVIAWMGYRTPPAGMEATRDTYATRGALLLERDISGLGAARGTREQPVVNIVAHSYGATTAALALSQYDLGVAAFVMLGSAGVDTHIRSVQDLHAARVYVAEAAADQEARWGRIDRRDPAGISFGATRIPVNGAKDLLGVTGHEPIVHSPWNDNPESPLWAQGEDAKAREELYASHMASEGYLDPGTQSLANIGIVSTPALTRNHTRGPKAEA